MNVPDCGELTSIMHIEKHDTILIINYLFSLLFVVSLLAYQITDGDVDVAGVQY
jgi:hypothetical protein